MNPHLLALHACIEEENAALTQFVHLLQAESRALTEHESFEALQAITDDKNVHAQALAELGQRRDQLLGELSLPGGYAGTQEAVLQHEHADLAEQWERLLDVSAQAQEINRRNGILIETHLRYTQQSLQALRSTAVAQSIYDASGRPKVAGAAGKQISMG